MQQHIGKQISLGTNLGNLLRREAAEHVIQHPAVQRRGQNGRYIRGLSMSRTALRIINSDHCTAKTAGWKQV